MKKHCKTTVTVEKEWLTQEKLSKALKTNFKVLGKELNSIFENIQEKWFQQW